MDFLIPQKRFDFCYDGQPFDTLAYTTHQREENGTVTTVYTFAQGLQITHFLARRGDAYEWVNYLENTGTQPTGVISSLMDARVSLPIAHEEPWHGTAYQPNPDDITLVYAPSGSTWTFDEFCSDARRSADNLYQGHLRVNHAKRYAASGGRSSEKNAPFFNVHKDGKGYIFAIGWSGQWSCTLSRTTDELHILAGIEQTHFRLLPGEKIRTASFVLMPYEGSVIDSQNQWRRVLRDHFSLIGREGRDAYGPLCASVWGGMKTSSVLDRIRVIQENQLPYEYVWMDAGWYGDTTKPTPDEFEGDWSQHTGDWRVSPLIHSNNLRDVADAVHAAGMKFLLWVEPERVVKTTPTAMTHPEYFFLPADEKAEHRLLNLGREDAWNYCFQTLSQLIREIGVDCYRQDFNMPPLATWRHNDAPDRLGMSEIRHINGLYRLWDALLEAYPHLLIDNCASGGRRIDVETLRRSIPLWRSDYQCPANHLPEGVQCHHLSFNQWMPFSGTGTGRPYDTYQIRSSYSPALTANYTFSERETFGDDPQKMAWLRDRLHEYLKVRSLMTEDFYPLSQVSDRKDVWCASQFNRPSQWDGFVLIFRREESPYESATYMLQGLDKDADYLFVDADDSSETLLSGDALCTRGFAVSMPEKRSSKLIFYHKA